MPSYSLNSLEEKVEFLYGPLEEELTTHVTGNAPRELKELPVKWLLIFGATKGFAKDIRQRVKVVDVSVVPNIDDPLKNDAKVTTEIEVTPDMCNGKGVVDDACKVFLIDESSGTVLITANALEGRGVMSGVSLNMNVSFHAPATIGTKLRIISRSLASGSGLDSCRCEIWDTNNNRLVASAAHTMIAPSIPFVA